MYIDEMLVSLGSPQHIFLYLPEKISMLREFRWGKNGRGDPARPSLNIPLLIVMTCVLLIGLQGLHTMNTGGPILLFLL
jgi:hypothetical protein